MSTTPTHSLTSLKPLPAEKVAKLKAAAMQPRQPATDAAAGAQMAISPGVERWPVKTGTDADVAKVGVNAINGENLGAGIVDTTVEELVKLPRANDMPPLRSSFTKNSFYQNHRDAPPETTVWRLKALVVEARLEQDGDYHLVLRGTTGQEMIGEIPNPDPAFVKNPVWLADIKVARDAMNKKLGAPLKAVGFAEADMAPPTEERFANKRKPNDAPAMTQVNAQATIIGVGFFDSDHGQTGVAPTAIEIHPILSIVFG